VIGVKSGLVSAAALALLVASIGGCDSGEDDATDAVREAYDIYEATMVAGDAAGWISNWTEEPVALWADEPMVAGKAEMEAAQEAWLGWFDYSTFDIEVLEVVTTGDWAYASGTYTANRVDTESGEEISDDGKFMSIFQKQSDGSWKLHRDAPNSNVPPQCENQALP
jgi:ketosteroid isomerase-like protein